MTLKRSALYLVRTASAPSNVIPIGERPATPAPPRERAWRDLVRRLRRNQTQESRDPDIDKPA